MWCGDLKHAREYVDYQIERFGRHGRWAGNEPLMVWNGVAEVEFRMNGEEVGEEEVSEEAGEIKEKEVKDLKRFLELVRWWYVEFKKQESWGDLNVPKVFRVVGQQDGVLAEMVDGVFVAPPVTVKVL